MLTGKKKSTSENLAIFGIFLPLGEIKAKRKEKKSPTILKVKSNCIWQIIKKKNVIYYQTTVMDWFPFVSLQIQLNFFFRDLVFSCQDLVKISQELNQFFINLLLEWQKLETVADRTP